MKRILIKLEVIIGCLVIGLLFGSEVKADDERIFEDANSYTVKIKTQVEIPFKEDEAGVFSGAGFLVDQERGWIMTNAHVFQSLLQRSRLLLKIRIIIWLKRYTWIAI